MPSTPFALAIAAVFVAVFAGVYWTSKRAPVPAIVASAVKPNPKIPTFEQAREAGIRKDWHDRHTLQSDNNRERDTLRLDAIQAPTAYGLSPCDPTMKGNFIRAITAYLKAMTAEMGCTGMRCGDDKKLDAGAAAFASPLDMRVRQLIGDAFEKGGVTSSDFPPALKLWVATLAASHGDPANPCARPLAERR